MALVSRLLRDNPDLQQCLLNDNAHVTPGAQGDHVCLIQRALVMLGEKSVTSLEYIKGFYGPSTAAAVLAYKTKRNIVNHAYQSKADNIVGKMTIARLDAEVRGVENIQARF
jgi:peptidoglycan hydrolase-like protein with peptidoglycan-binding domain